MTDQDMEQAVERGIIRALNKPDVQQIVGMSIRTAIVAIVDVRLLEMGFSPLAQENRENTFWTTTTRMRGNKIRNAMIVAVASIAVGVTLTFVGAALRGYFVSMMTEVVQPGKK